MKKAAALAVALLVSLSAALRADAKGDWLIKGGVSNSNLDLNRDIATVVSEIFSKTYFSTYTGYNVGVGYQTDSWNGLKLQPELLYNICGTTVDDATAWRMGYLRGSLGLQWGLDLVVLRPFLQVSPYAGYDFSNNVIGNTEVSQKMGDIAANASRLAYGVGLGGGIDLLNRMQISVSYDWNFGYVANLEAYAAKLKGIERKNATCLQLSLAILL